MANQWFYIVAGRTVGPVPDSRLQRLVTYGIITPETLVRTHDTLTWSMARQIKGLITPKTNSGADPQPGAVKVAHLPTPESELLLVVDDEPEPAPIQPVAAPAPKRPVASPPLPPPRLVEPPVAPPIDPTSFNADWHDLLADMQPALMPGGAEPFAPPMLRRKKKRKRSQRNLRAAWAFGLACTSACMYFGSIVFTVLSINSSPLQLMLGGLLTLTACFVAIAGQIVAFFALQRPRSGLATAGCWLAILMGLFAELVIVIGIVLAIMKSLGAGRAGPVK